MPNLIGIDENTAEELIKTGDVLLWLKNIDYKVARKLAECKWLLSLKLDSLSKWVANELRKHEGPLHLYWFDEITVDVAKLLTLYDGKDLLIDIDKIGKEQAQALSFWSYKNPWRTLRLWVSELSENAAAELLKHNGPLDLYDLKKITPEVESQLMKHEWPLYISSWVDQKIINKLKNKKWWCYFTNTRIDYWRSH